VRGDQPMNKAPSQASLYVVIGLMVLLSVGALGGGAALIAGPDGGVLGVPADLLLSTPFSSYLIPGILLFTVRGVYPLVVSYSLWARPGWRWPDLLNPFPGTHWAWAAAISVGVAVIVWIATQMTLLGCCHWLQYLYLFWGIVLLVVVMLPPMKRLYVR